MAAAQAPEMLAGVAKQAALAGGAELMKWRGRFETHEKGPSDYVTDADLASQEAIRSLLSDRFPDHQFVGEESDRPGLPEPGRLCWVVDPLDGTTNYLHDFPCFAVSVAVVLAGKPLAGAIFDPIREELFWAAKGLGAWRGGTRLATSGVRSLSEALVAISLPASVVTESPDLRDFVRIAPRCQAVRRIGSAALNLAYVACGRLDTYWAREIHAWDVAAGALLVTEAGGVVTDSAGGEFSVWQPPCIASCGADLHADLLSQLRD